MAAQAPAESCTGFSLEFTVPLKEFSSTFHKANHSLFSSILPLRHFFFLFLRVAIDFFDGIHYNKRNEKTKRLVKKESKSWKRIKNEKTQFYFD